MPLTVNIAGYNIDKSLIDSLDNPAATPEVISAAYARISRSEKSVTELRSEALAEIAKARKSNENIIFEMGHSSIAEHAVFNIDIIGISRLLAETVESVRLASFTEKSQRYVTFEDDFVIPEELQNETKYKRARYVNLNKKLFEEYHQSYERLLSRYKRQKLGLSPRELEGKAKEDARYILPLSTKTQLGMTINARSLENLLRKLKNNPTAEAQELYTALLEPMRGISPSLIRYTEDPGLAGSFKASSLGSLNYSYMGDNEVVRLINFVGELDDHILACILYEQTACDFDYCVRSIQELSIERKQELWKQVFAGLQAWHKLPRSFEMVDFTFELLMSESCWGQFKRHRMGSVIKKSWARVVPVSFPDSIFDVKREEIWNELFEKVLILRDQYFYQNDALRSYLRLNFENVQVLAKMNLRELYHFVRLRSDEHAQWEIRSVSDWIIEYLRTVAPNASRFLGGKSQMTQKD